MPRAKGGPKGHLRHKKLLKLAKGFRGRRKNVFKLAKNAVMKAGTNAYRDRRRRRRQFHKLWIARLNAACRSHGLNYSRFIYGMELERLLINRKMLAELAVHHPGVLKEIVERVKTVLPPPGQAPKLEDLKARV